MKLLIVDDSKLNRIMASNYISNSDLDLEILEAESSEEAMLVLQDEDIDLILLDIIMSGMDGIGLLKWIKSKDIYKHIKVIMFTTLNEKTLLQDCFDIGASDFIQKPIENIEFVARIKSIKRQRQLELETQAYIQEITEQKTIISDVQMHMMQQDKMASVGQLAAGIAHEINNPLGFISSNFSMLKEYTNTFVDAYKQFLLDAQTGDFEASRSLFLDEDFSEIIEDMDELFDETAIGVDRVKKIVTSLRNFSRVDRTEAVEAYSVNEGLKDTLIIASNNIKYVANVETDFGSVPTINVIASQINQVFLNILVNAVYAISSKFENAMGLITVNTFVEDGYIVIELMDNGCGMSEETLRSLFHPFYTTKPVGDGTGLGLSISYDIIVNKHNGRIEVDSVKGQGSVFKIWLPIN